MDASWSQGITPPSIYARAASVGHNPANIPPPEERQEEEDEEEDEEEAGIGGGGRERERGASEALDNAATAARGGPKIEGPPRGEDYIWRVPESVEEQRALSYCSPILFREDLVEQASRTQAGGVIDALPCRGWSYVAIDVRPREAWERIRLAGSIHVGWSELEDQTSTEAGPVPGSGGRERASSCLEQLQVTVPGYGSSLDGFGQEPSPSRATSRTVEEEAHAEEVAAAVVSRVNVLVAEWLIGLGYGGDDPAAAYVVQDGEWPDREAIEAEERKRERPPHVVCIVVIGARDNAAGECAAALIEAHVPHVAILQGGIEGILDDPQCAGVLAGTAAGLQASNNPA
jgi:rhodanese-related sulfurtransferase